MVTRDKEIKMKALQDKMYGMVDSGEGLNSWQQTAFDIFGWLLDDQECPMDETDLG